MWLCFETCVYSYSVRVTGAVTFEPPGERCACADMGASHIHDHSPYVRREMCIERRAESDRADRRRPRTVEVSSSGTLGASGSAPVAVHVKYDYVYDSYKTQRRNSKHERNETTKEIRVFQKSICVRNSYGFTVFSINILEYAFIKLFTLVVGMT